MSIAGQAALTTTVDGNGSGSVFYIVESSAVVTLTGFTIANGTQGLGNWGTLTVEDSRITGNSAPFRCGGILNGGTLTLNWSTLNKNSAAVHGGGICNEDEGTAIINDSTIISNSVTGKDGGNGGGGVYSAGNITLTNSAVISNSGYQGGGIFTQESLFTLNNSTVISNSAVGEGGGIYNEYGSVTLSYSTVTSNTASFGGAIYNRNGVTVTIDHSTLSHNSGFYAGSGLYNEYSSDLVSIEYSTLSDNSGFWSNGSIFNESGGTMVVSYSTVINNSADAADFVIHNSGELMLANTIVSSIAGLACSGTVNSLGYNIAGDNSCALTGSGDMNNTDPLLGPLQDNGGPTQTHLPLPSSPAIDAGDPLNCPPTDQRGVARPHDGDGDGSSICDIGSVEYWPPVYFVYLPIAIRP